MKKKIIIYESIVSSRILGIYKIHKLRSVSVGYMTSCFSHDFRNYRKLFY